MASGSQSSKLIVKAYIAGTEIAIKEGSCNFTKQVNDSTGSTSGGWQEFTVGNRGMTFTLSGDTKKLEPKRAITDTKAIEIPANADEELVAFKFFYADGGGCEGVAIMQPTITGNPASGANVGWSISGTASGPVTDF